MRTITLLLFSMIFGQLSAFGDGEKQTFYCLKYQDEPSLISVKACGPDPVNICQQKVLCIADDEKSILYAYNIAHKDQPPLTSFDQIHDDKFIIGQLQGTGQSPQPGYVNCMALPPKSGEGPRCPAPNDCKDDRYVKPVQATNAEPLSGGHIPDLGDLSQAPAAPAL